MSMVLVLLLLTSVQQQVTGTGVSAHPARQSNVDLRVAVTGEKCGLNCVVITQTLTNRGTLPTAVHVSPSALVTHLRAEVRRDKPHHIGPGAASTSIGENLRDTRDAIPCRILQPKESMTTKAEISIPKSFAKGSVIHLVQEYSEYSVHQCEGVDFFSGTSKSNDLRFLYK